MIDSNSCSREILKAMVSEMHAAGEAVSDAAAASDLLREAEENDHPYDVVLLDAHVPGQDSFELARVLSLESRRPLAVVMMLTSCDLVNNAQRCYGLGIHSYLVKPVSLAELGTALKNAGQQSETAPAPPENVAPQVVKGQALRILVAEDNSVNALLARKLLSKQGHSVEMAGNGLEAVRKSAEECFDVILMDVQMPEMDGFEATRAIRERERGTGIHVPILAVTAHAMSGYRDLCLDAGMDGYLTKPIRTEELANALSDVSAPKLAAS